MDGPDAVDGTVGDKVGRPDPDASSRSKPDVGMLDARLRFDKMGA
jgi:hypothetical protein